MLNPHLKIYFKFTSHFLFPFYETEAQDYLHRRNLIDDEDIDQFICVGEVASNNEVVNENEDEIVFGMTYPWFLED
jgi:hypothetical protein